MLTLYDYFRSSACYRVRIALNLKELNYQLAPIHLINHGGEQHSEKYQAINPQELIPALQDNDQIITQSLAIMEYIDELHPKPPLLPGNAYQKALIRAFALTIIADIHPLNNLRVLNYLQNDLAINTEQKDSWYQHWIAKGFSALEKKLTQLNMHSEFCFGDQPTLADICLVPQMFNARRTNCDLTAYPTLVRIDENCRKYDAFLDAAPMEITA